MLCYQLNLGSWAGLQMVIGAFAKRNNGGECALPSLFLQSREYIGLLDLDAAGSCGVWWGELQLRLDHYYCLQASTIRLKAARLSIPVSSSLLIGAYTVHPVCVSNRIDEPIRNLAFPAYLPT